MALTCDIYKGPIKLGAGSVSGGSAAVGSWVAVGSPHTVRRNVTVVITQAGDHIGRSFNTRIMTDDGGGNLVLKDLVPFVE